MEVKMSANKESNVSRRQILKTTAVIGAGTMLGASQVRGEPTETPALKGRVNQPVCKWCYPKMSVEELAKNAQRLGLKGIDLVHIDAFPTLKKYGLVSTMTNH